MLRTSVVSSLILVLCFDAIAAAQTGPRTGDIRVAVRVEGTQEPISGVELTLNSATNCGNCLLDLPDNEEDLLGFLRELAAARGVVNGELGIRVDASPVAAPPPKAITDESGNASFRDVRFGTYEVSARLVGYRGVRFFNTDYRVVTSESSVKVTVGQDQTPSDALLYLIPTATIRGNVHDMNGLGVANVSVSLVPVREEGGQRTLGAPAGTAKTDASGEYILTAEQLGNFLVRIARTSSGIMSFVYYPRNTDSVNATRITLERGMSLTDIDFQLK